MVIEAGAPIALAVVLWHGEHDVVGWPTGLEPVTFGATIRCSAIELRPPPRPRGRALEATMTSGPNGSVLGSGRRYRRS
jgi:hypothetical protein